LTFATIGLFAHHWITGSLDHWIAGSLDHWIAGDYGSCRDPATLIYRTAQRAGERVMFWRDGLWWAPEMTGEEKVAAFGERAS